MSSLRSQNKNFNFKRLAEERIFVGINFGAKNKHPKDIFNKFFSDPNFFLIEYF